MLKIKDNIDLKELEKFGLYLEKSIFGISFTDKNIEVDKKDRKISCFDYLELLDLDKYNDIIFDLIKADLVEKVDD